MIKTTVNLSLQNESKKKANLAKQSLLSSKEKKLVIKNKILSYRNHTEANKGKNVNDFICPLALLSCGNVPKGHRISFLKTAWWRGGRSQLENENRQVLASSHLLLVESLRFSSSLREDQLFILIFILTDSEVDDRNFR